MEPKDSLPFSDITKVPGHYHASAMAARMVEGLGFRYYWATEGLREADLAYRPSPDGRTLGETLEHLLRLSEMIANSARQEPNVRPAEPVRLGLPAMRERTLRNLAEACDTWLSTAADDMAAYDMQFERSGAKSSVPFWYLINGPVADAIWHVGQVTAFRRAAGNPVLPGVDWFKGKPPGQ